MDKITRYLKAHTAAVLAVAFWLVAALHDGNISAPEWLGLPAALGIGGAVAAVPNRPAKKRTRRAADAGMTVIEALFTIVVALILVWLIVVLIRHVS